jgi:hypothetical protein
LHHIEQANALFVVYVETVLDTSCYAPASDAYGQKIVDDLKSKTGTTIPDYHKQPFINNPWNPLFYQNVQASIEFEY